MNAQPAGLALLVSALIVIGISPSQAAIGHLEAVNDSWERSDWDRSIPGHEFASSAVIHGDMALIGEPGQLFPHPQYSWQGRVHIYRRVCSRWMPVQVLEMGGSAGAMTKTSRFGAAIATDGMRIVVGAPHFATELGNHVGAVWVYDFNGTTWQPTGPIFLPNDPAPGDKFGYSVAINGDWLFVGAPRRAETAFLSGAVYVFRYMAGQWIHHVASSPIVSESDVQDDVRFGMSLATDDDLLVIGAPNDSYEGLRRGSVAVHRLEGDQWVHETRLVIPGNTVYAGFGESIDVDNGLVVVGAPTSGSPQAGTAWTFIFDPKQWQWGASSELTTTLPISTGRQYGKSVSISGQTILVGAPGQSICSVHEFNNGQWIETEFIIPDECEVQQFFGESVSIDGDYVVAGAPNVTSAPGTINFYSIFDVAHLLPLNSWNVVAGIWQGNLDRLQCTDNLRLQGMSEPSGQNQIQQATVRVQSTAPTDVDHLHITIESSHPSSPASGVVGCQVQLRNWGTGNFDVLADFTVQVVDTPEPLVKLQCVPADNYVRPTDGRVELRLRFRYTMINLGEIFPFHVDVDLIEIRSSMDD